jgi:hypothetical protein
VYEELQPDRQVKVPVRSGSPRPSANPKSPSVAFRFSRKLFWPAFSTHSILTSFAAQKLLQETHVRMDCST